MGAVAMGSQGPEGDETLPAAWAFAAGLHFVPRHPRGARLPAR